VIWGQFLFQIVDINLTHCFLKAFYREPRLLRSARAGNFFVIVDQKLLLALYGGDSTKESDGVENNERVGVSLCYVFQSDFR